jgi:hypothetical protein
MEEVSNGRPDHGNVLVRASENVQAFAQRGQRLGDAPKVERAGEQILGGVVGFDVQEDGQPTQAGARLQKDRRQVVPGRGLGSEVDGQGRCPAPYGRR